MTGIRRLSGLACVGALAVTLSMLALSCAANPPRVAIEDVTDFWVAPGRDSEPDFPLYRPPGSIASVITAYNQAAGDSFDSNTTPPLQAGRLLRDGTEISLQFSPLFPENHALVGVRREQPETAELYEVDAPGLLAAIWELAGDHLDTQVLESESGWLPD